MTRPLYVRNRDHGNRDREGCADGIGEWFAKTLKGSISRLIDEGKDRRGRTQTVEDRKRILADGLRHLVELHEEGIITPQELEYGTNYWLDHYQPTIEQAWDTVASDPIGLDSDYWL